MSSPSQAAGASAAVAGQARATIPLHPFRPLFFLAATFSALDMVLWALFLRSGWLPPSPLISPLWHGHEMLFGFGGALISGFLLTATANWTKRATTTPLTLTGLCIVWLAARLSFLLNAPLELSTALDLAWIVILLAMVTRVLVLSRNKRNYFVIALVLSYGALDAAFLGGAMAQNWVANSALVWAVDWFTILMLVIGGRIIPVFSRNKLPEIKPAVRKPLLMAVNVGAAIALLLAVAGADGLVRGAFWLLLALLALVRLIDWHGWRSLREPMLWSLHLGYLWLVIGMTLRGLALVGAMGDVWGNPALHNAIHGITIGALGTLSVSMMTRVAQGHSHVPIKGNTWIAIMFLLPSVAAIVRLAGGAGAWPEAGFIWTVAYLMYLVAIGPLLVRGRAAVTAR
ncbi:MAG TPA: NnrS family protein [Nevskiaceae bacterium]